IRLQLEYINRLEINVAYPFLMKVYDDYFNSVIDKEIFLEVLDLVQSFTWRRFILGLPTNALNKIFMSLMTKLSILIIYYQSKNLYYKEREFSDSLKMQK
ncbi:MAG: hypothetical protein V9F02_12840, partial [Chitinophagaceae bacterium]